MLGSLVQPDERDEAVLTQVHNLETGELQCEFMVSCRQGSPQLSPDGRWLVFRSGEDGREQLHRLPGALPLGAEGGHDLLVLGGAAERLEAAGDPRLEQRKQARIVNQHSALAGKPLEVFGDGTSLRDPVYVDDVVDDVLALVGGAE